MPGFCTILLPILPSWRLFIAVESSRVAMGLGSVAHHILLERV